MSARVEDGGQSKGEGQRDEPILLVGAGFKNRGAEAMALATIDELAARYPGHRIVVASYADRERLPWGPTESEGRQFELIPNRKRLSHLLRVPLHALTRRTPLGDFFIRGDAFLANAARSTFVVDLSGFALTDRRPLWRRLVYAFEIFTARCLGRPFVALTQAFGPFHRFSTRFIARTMLPRTALVVVRGDRSRSNLGEIGVDRRTRVEQCADIAYLFEPSSARSGRKLLEGAGAREGPLVGIVPNVNIFDLRGPPDERNPYLLLLERLCRVISADLEASPVLICHEEHPGRLDDRWIADEVAGRFDRPIPVLSGSISAATLKAVVGELDLAVASRFHSVVAAISMQTPVVALGWAHKYTELMEEAGLGDLAMDARYADDEDVVRLVSGAWEERRTIRGRLGGVPIRLEASAREAFDHLVDACPPTRPGE